MKTIIFTAKEVPAYRRVPLCGEGERVTGRGREMKG
jgi:hypothetical protein